MATQRNLCIGIIVVCEAFFSLAYGESTNPLELKLAALNSVRGTTRESTMAFESSATKLLDEYPDEVSAGRIRFRIATSMASSPCAKADTQRVLDHAKAALQFPQSDARRATLHALIGDVNQLQLATSQVANPSSARQTVVLNYLHAIRLALAYAPKPPAPGVTHLYGAVARVNLHDMRLSPFVEAESNPGKLTGRDSQELFIQRELCALKIAQLCRADKELQQYLVEEGRKQVGDDELKIIQTLISTPADQINTGTLGSFWSRQESRAAGQFTTFPVAKSTNSLERRLETLNSMRGTTRESTLAFERSATKLLDEYSDEVSAGKIRFRIATSMASSPCAQEDTQRVLEHAKAALQFPQSDARRATLHVLIGDVTQLQLATSQVANPSSARKTVITNYLHAIRLAGDQRPIPTKPAATNLDGSVVGVSPGDAILSSSVASESNSGILAVRELRELAMHRELCEFKIAQLCRADKELQQYLAEEARKLVSDEELKRIQTRIASPTDQINKGIIKSF